LQQRPDDLEGSWVEMEKGLADSRGLFQRAPIKPVKEGMEIAIMGEIAKMIELRGAE
jgi:hypothetical protein